MFLKVQRLVSEHLFIPKLFLIIDLFLIAKLLELLAINHRLSERRIFFIPWLVKLSHVVAVL